MHGYAGRYLVVDLATGNAREEALAADVLRRVIGGTGLATLLVGRHTPAGADPLGPDNALVFANSPLVGTPLTTTSKFAIAAKSPQTGCIGDSLSSSHMAIALKRTGYDAIVLTGRCSEWSALHVSPAGVRLVPASGLLGLDTAETEGAARRRLGDAKARVAAIGPAGERGVRYATISNDGRHAGRTGTGAVMGSKRLKAMAVRGDAHVRVADPAALDVLAASLRERSLGEATAKYRMLGTTANLHLFERLGALPVRNFQTSVFATAEAVSGERLHETRLQKRTGCAHCTIGCEHIYETRDAASPSSSRLEYETLYALGPMCGVADPDSVIRAAARCDALGIDTISTGVTIAWAMECFERGVLTLGDTGGIDLRFGNARAVLAAIEAIGAGDGIGRLLGEGCRRAAAEVGQGSEAWAMHVKGLELPGYEPRSLKTMALGLAISSRGACHNRSSAYEADFSGAVDRLKAEAARGNVAADAEDSAAILDCLILCKFVRRCLDDLAADAASMLRAVTGWGWDGPEVRHAAARVTTLKKLFNIREGWRREDDTLPPRLLAEPLADGAVSGAALTRDELDTMIGGYYAARGWTADGLVPAALVRELELEDLLTTA